MTAKKSRQPCAVCNPADASPGEYCEEHREELHKLEHQYESLFRLRRTSRGKDHESYDILLQGECEPCGRLLVAESHPDNLAMTLILAQDIDLDTRLPEYDALGIPRTWGDNLKEKIQQELIYCWYGDARACVDVFHSNIENRQHWDFEPRDEDSEDGEMGPEPHAPGNGGKHSVH
jgi:hypothetical protein